MCRQRLRHLLSASRSTNVFYWPSAVLEYRLSELDRSPTHHLPSWNSLHLEVDEELQKQQYEHATSTLSTSQSYKSRIAQVCYA